MATVRCVFAAELHLPGGHRGGSHTHACTEIVYYVTGAGRLVQDTDAFDYRPECVSVYQPTQHHSCTTRGDSTQLCLGINGCGAENLPASLWPVDEPLAATFRQVLTEVRKPPSDATQERLDILAGWVVLELRRLAGGKPCEDDFPEPVRAAREVLDARFDEAIDLQELAGSLYISPDYLRHIFKQCLGESPLNYLIRRRLDSACELLNFTDLPVQEVARRVGLENPYYFSRIFRKKIGMPPSQYRQHIRRRARDGRRWQNN